jgi:hypothetical protein
MFLWGRICLIGFNCKSHLVALVLSSSITGLYGPLSVLSRSITGNGIQLCLYWYWHFCALVQYQYGHNSLPALACYYAHTGICIFALWFSTSIGIVRYQYWHSIVPVLVLAFLHFCSVPVWAQYITTTGILYWCPYWYWHFST